jgi:aspartyl-tRNA(Asn)/glutamyl-tRNA(Gln) amidotransferase subunit C
MSITAEEVRKLATLSRIELSEEETGSMQNDMSSILGYIDQINKAGLDLEQADEPLRKNIWREDINANESGEYTEKLLSAAPSREGEYVKVKKIL